MDEKVLGETTLGEAIDWAEKEKKKNPRREISLLELHPSLGAVIIWNSESGLNGTRLKSS